MTTSAPRATAVPVGSTSDHCVRRRRATIVSSIVSSGISGSGCWADTDARAERGPPAAGAPAIAETGPDVSGKASGSLIGERDGAHGSSEGAARRPRERA